MVLERGPFSVNNHLWYLTSPFSCPLQLCGSRVLFCTEHNCSRSLWQRLDCCDPIGDGGIIQCSYIPEILHSYALPSARVLDVG